MRQIGPYRVEEEIGRGGMATVYRVSDPQGQLYALKLLHAAPTQDKRWGTRFRREFRLLSRLRHNHLIEVHDYGEDEHHAYYVMDYINGTNLWKFYREQLRTYPVHERLTWLIPLMSQIVSALDYIHHHRVIHKDLKPANILLQHDGENAYLADFGLARELQDSAQYTHPGFMGTLGYSAPELVDRGRFDGRADIYSLGVILYTLLADRRPIQVEGRSFQDLLIAIHEEEPYPIGQLLPDLPAEIAHLIHRCIEKDPADRYRDTRELWRDLLPQIEYFQRIRSEQQASSTSTSPSIPSIQAIAEPLFAAAEESSVHQAPPLVESEILGRSVELELCQSRFLALCNQGQSHAILLYGPSGIGKSFLLEELRRQFQRQSSFVYTIRLRPHSQPLGSLTETIRPLLLQLPADLLESNNAQLLAHYLPGLQDILPTPQIVAGPLTQPVLQLSNLLLPFLLQFPQQSHLVWMLDDFHQADQTSKQILVQLLSTLLSYSAFGLLVIATLTYTPEDPIPPIAIEDHPRLIRHAMPPLCEEDESLLVARLMGRAPTHQELTDIRTVTRGLPMRTMELLHQGTLLAQSPFKSVQQEEVSSGSEDIMSSVSTALHDLSSFQDALGLNRVESPAGSVDLHATMHTPSGQQPQPTSPPPSQGELTPDTSQTLFSLTDDEALDILDEAVEQEITIPIKIKRDALPPLASATAAKESLFLPEPEEGTLQTDAFNPEQTIMMPISPVQMWNAAQPGKTIADPTNLQLQPPVVHLLEEFDEESIQELDSTDEYNENNAHLRDTTNPINETDVGERTLMQGDLRPSRLAGMSGVPQQRLATIHDTPNHARTMISEPLVPQSLSATIIERPGDAVSDGPTSQHELMRLSESSEELVLIPLLQRRLDLLEPAHRLRLAATSFLTEEFTYDELRETIQSPPEEALDLLNVLLSLRLLKVEAREQEEYYSHLHPVMQQLLGPEIPQERYGEFALRAAKAMVTSRKEYHRHAHAALLAVRFTEGGEPVQAFEWQLFDVLQALQHQHDERLQRSLHQLQQILAFWIQRGAKIQLLQVLPRLFDPETQHISLMSQVGQQLLLVGILHMFEAKDTVTVQSQKARVLLRQLLSLTPGAASQAFQNTLHYLAPLLQFARLRIRKKQ